jgi:hypothetical protein
VYCTGRGCARCFCDAEQQRLRRDHVCSLRRRARCSLPAQRCAPQGGGAALTALCCRVDGEVKVGGADVMSPAEMEELLDSNCTILRELTRLRYTRPAGEPCAAERNLMQLVETNLSLLVAAQKPRTIVSSRSALATRAMMQHVEPPAKPEPPKVPLAAPGMGAQGMTVGMAAGAMVAGVGGAAMGNAGVAKGAMGMVGSGAIGGMPGAGAGGGLH